MVYTCKRILCSHQNEQGTDTCWMNFKDIVLFERNQTQEATYCIFHLVVSVQNRWIHRVIKQEGGCRGLGKRRMGNDGLMGNRVFFWKGERFGTRRGQWLHRIVNILNATELFTFKWLILCFVNSTLIF